jgi:hypothetical protein
MSHWYTKEAEPMHYMPTADGTGTRDTTLRDARKLNLRPSVTGIIDLLDKPGLNRASQSRLIEAAYHIDVLQEDADSFKAKVRFDAFDPWDQARIIGGEIHESVEAIFNDQIPELHVDIATKAVEAIGKYCDTLDFVPEQTVVGDGYGGTIDLNNPDIIVDWKSKDITDKQWNDYEAGKNPRMAYDEMCMQLVAYDKALGGDARRLINVFIDRTIAGRVIIHEWTQVDAGRAWKQFSLLVQYWQITKKYAPE